MDKVKKIIVTKTNKKKEGNKNKKIKTRINLKPKETRRNEMTETKKPEVKEENKNNKEKKRNTLISEKTKKRIVSASKTAGRAILDIGVGSLSVALGIWIGKQIPPIFGNTDNLEDVL